MTIGYKTITPIQIGNLLYALASDQITWLTARVWFACLEMVAIREAAQRVRRLNHDKRLIEPRFKRTELMELTGLNVRAVGKAVASIRRCGLVTLTAKEIAITPIPMPGAEATIQNICGGRSPKRPIPVPRTLLRFLASQPKAGLGKVMLGYVCRGLSIDRQGGGIREAGTVKASWLADALSMSLRSVRYAQAELRYMGWIPKDMGSRQGKLNRHGAWFCINLDWKPHEDGMEGDSCNYTHIPPVALPAPEFCTAVAPPKKDLKTPLEFKNQKPGVLKKEIKLPVRTATAKAVRQSAPDLRNIRTEDLQMHSRLKVLLGQAIEKGWVKDCDADAQNFFAAAVRARAVTKGDPVRIFVTLVRRRLWHHITQAEEDRARQIMQPNRLPVRDADGLTRAEPGQAGKILSSMLLGLPALERMSIPVLKHPSCGTGLRDNRRSSQAPRSRL